MKRSYTRETCQTCSSRLIIVPFIKGGKNTAAKEIQKCFTKHPASKLQIQNFEGRFREILTIEADGGKSVLVAGLGESPDIRNWREAVAKSIAHAANRQFSSISIYLDELNETHVSACIEGATLGLYRFNRYKSSPKAPSLSQLKISSVQKDVLHTLGSRLVKAASIRADAVNFCRDLVNEPANQLSVNDIVDVARDIAKQSQLRCKVTTGHMLSKKGFGLIHAVGKGGAIPPALVEMTYTPEKKRGKKIALIGKGVVFDTGGLCLKPAASMAGMKTDMAGAAVVLSIMGALRALNCEHEVTAYLPLAENAIGNDAMRPGDVFKSYQGKTVEIANTDAEGRLLLADALALAHTRDHDEIIDFATLTGACSVALGKKRGAVFSNNQQILTQWLDAAQKAGELVWPLPLATELENEIKGEVADLKNCGDRFGGAITAALFLKQFTDANKWVHFDIAGPARNATANILCPRGGTGFMVLTILGYLQNI